MSTIFAGKMRFVTMIPNGSYKNNDNQEIPMWKVLLQDREDLQLHEFKFAESERNTNLIEQCKDLMKTPMTDVNVVLQMEFNRFAKAGQNPTKISLRELYEIIPGVNGKEVK